MITLLAAASILVSTGSSARGEPALLAARLHGVWDLESFSILNNEKKRQPWGFDATGLLIYTPDGHVSVAINRFAAWSSTGRPTEPADASARSLFYAGRYEVRGPSIVHFVEVASNPARLGVPQRRRVVLEDGLLTLTTEDQGVWAELVWRRR
jgi:hypothetical protein